LSEQNVEAATGTGAFRQTGGTTNLRGIRIIGPVLLNGGVLNGAGVIEGDLTNDGGFIAPGNSAGAIGVTGNFTQTAKGSLLLEVGGINSYIPQFDRLKIGGTAALDGKLTVTTINGFTPNPNLPLVPLSYSSATGGFASTSGNVQLDLQDTGAALSVAGANPPLPSLRNISTRGVTLTGDKVMIGGFIVTGPSGSTKKVLVRGLGPTLTKYGVPNALSDPALSLYKPGGAVENNNDWEQASNAGQIPTDLRPEDRKEPAILTELSPGSYTAILQGTNGGTGNTLVEVYDLEPGSATYLGNISTRGPVGTGDSVMIAGLIVHGSEPAKVLVRAVGPSLTQYGVPDALQDPTLSLHDANGSVITNDDWRGTQESEITASGKPPQDAREPAMVMTLVPGSYTAIVRQKQYDRGCVGGMLRSALSGVGRH